MGRAPRARARSSFDFEVFQQALSGRSGDSGGRFDAARDRKTLQLCRQVERALSLALAGECDDEALRDLVVDGVEPMGSAAQLLVRVLVPASAGVAAIDVMRRLDEKSSRLRAIVAQSICRKRTPSLTFVALPAVPPGEPKGGCDVG